MTINFRDETFRDNFTFRNSPEAIKRFPFPFHEDSYMYSVNMEPHKSYRPGSVFERTFDVDEHSSRKWPTGPKCWPKIRFAANRFRI
jgi:dimethylamine monooxygenase subunit A